MGEFRNNVYVCVKIDARGEVMRTNGLPDSGPDYGIDGPLVIELYFSFRRMDVNINMLGINFNKIRTGRAHPSILDGIYVSYYGNDTPLSQVANVSVSDARTLTISPWEKKLVTEIEKAINSTGYKVTDKKEN